MDFGARRLNARAQMLMEWFSANPMASIPMACDNWAETCAVYGLLSNDEVEWRGIIEPHWLQTRQRMSACPVVLCLQDTTELDFNGQDIAGLGH